MTSIYSYNCSYLKIKIEGKKRNVLRYVLRLILIRNVPNDSAFFVRNILRFDKAYGNL